MAHLRGAGAEKTCIDILRNFDHERHQITLLLIYREGVYVSEIPKEVNVISLYPHLPGRWHEKVYKRIPTLRDRGMRKRLKEAMGDKSYDVIISFCEGLPVKVHSFMSDRAPVNLTWVHCDMERYPWTRRYFRKLQDEKKAYSIMDRIVFVSDDAREAFQRKYGFGTKAVVIPNVIDREDIRSKAESFDVDKRRFTIINIGRLVPVKNQRRLIEMMSILTERGHDAELWIAGEGPLHDKLSDLAREKGVEDRIRFLGFQSNPYPYLAKADVYVMSSDAEGYSLTVSEALCLGVPVVSTPAVRTEALRQTGAVEIAEFSSDSLADKVEMMINDPQKRAEYADHALESGRLFSPERVLKQMYRLIDAAED